MSFDFKIVVSSKDQISPLLDKIVLLNYKFIGIDYTCFQFGDITNTLKSYLEIYDSVKKYAEKLKIKTFKRITINSSSKLGKNDSLSKIISTFDIVCINPLTQDAFDDATHNLPIDLISFNAESFPALKMKSLIDVAVRRGIHIELIYNNILGNSEDNFIFFFGHTFNILRRSCCKKIILSSGASSPDEILGWSDVMNIGERCEIPRKVLSNQLKIFDSIISRSYMRNHTIMGIFEIEKIIPNYPSIKRKSNTEDVETQKTPLKQIKIV